MEHSDYLGDRGNIRPGVPERPFWKDALVAFGGVVAVITAAAALTFASGYLFGAGFRLAMGT